MLTCTWLEATTLVLAPWRREKWGDQRQGQGELIGAIVMDVQITRIHKHGASLCMILTKPIQEAICWRPGDRVAVRLRDGMLVLERVPMEELAKLRVHPAPESNKP